jgi:hypothetical protein
MSNNPLSQLFSNTADEDLRKAVVEKLINNDDLESKTELIKPLRWSCLNSIEDFIKSHKLPISSTILQLFIKTSFKYLISNDRKGRIEYIEALKALSNTMNNPNLKSDTNKLGV